MIEYYLRPYIGHIPLARLSPPAIDHLYGRLLDRGLAPSTVRRAANTLSAALTEARQQGLILRNPADNTTPPKVERYEPTVLTDEQIVEYLNDALATAIPTISALYCTAASCGLRLGELTGLRDDAVDLAAKMIRVKQGLVRAGRLPVLSRPKTETSIRSVGIPDELVPILQRAITWKKEQRLRLGPRFRDAGLLFCGEHGRPFNPSNLRNRDHYPRLARLGLPRTRPHDLRHFHGAELVAANVDPRTVADRLGHHSPAFTLKTCSHARRTAQAAAVTVASTLLVQLAKPGH